MNPLRERRSIRKYKNDPISEATEEALLRAAMAAPSAGNEQPWQFVVVRDRELLDGIPDFHPYATMLRQAPMAIIVCGDENLEQHKGYWVQDCAAATENILIEATRLGVGTCWLGLYPSAGRPEGMRRLLGIPETIIPFACIAVGWPDEKKDPSDRYDPKRVHHDQW